MRRLHHMAYLRQFYHVNNIREHKHLGTHAHMHTLTHSTNTGASVEQAITCNKFAIVDTKESKRECCFLDNL